jgi:ATP-dependent Clp protease ATP-binding subunit ClpA
LDKATLTLGDNRRVDLSATMIFMTSNLGGTEITDLVGGGRLGFAPVMETGAELDTKVARTASEAAKRKFAPEFMNRIDKVVVFHPLREEQLEQILEIELGMVQQRAEGRLLWFRVTPAARQFLLKEGTDLKYGARHLKRAIERHIVYPLASLLATEQVVIGDVLSIDWDATEKRLVFLKEEEGALIPIEAPTPQLAAEAAVASVDGRPIEMPSVNAVSEPPPPAPPIAVQQRPANVRVPRHLPADKTKSGT